MSDLCTIETRLTDRSTVARLIGEIDSSNATSIDGELRTIARAARNVVIIDLNDLEYVDSAGLAVFERLVKDLDCRMVISEDGTIYETLNIVGFNAGDGLYRSVAEVMERTP
jgi:anti-anti-sigma factor